MCAWQKGSVRECVGEEGRRERSEIGHSWRKSSSADSRYICHDIRRHNPLRDKVTHKCGGLALLRPIRVGAPFARVRCVETANERFTIAVQLPLHGGETGRTGECEGGWVGRWVGARWVGGVRCGHIRIERKEEREGEEEK